METLDTKRRAIIKFPYPLLERRSDTFVFDEEKASYLDTLIKDMAYVMHQSKGIGLAAPQIGIGWSIAIIDRTLGKHPENNNNLVLINPEITSSSGTQEGTEGCLSIPGFREVVIRSQHVTVQAQSRTGEFFETSGEGLLARAIQHEVDHLNGILYISRLEPARSKVVRRQAIRALGTY